MPSPFPGMDPWLERPGVWPDLHDRFLARLSDALNESLPPPFYAALATRVWLEESARRVVPDIDVLLGEGPAAGGGAAVLAAPVTAGMLELEAAPLREEISESVIEVYADADGEKLITSIELLSPANKTPGDGGRASYLAKQGELVRRGVHVWEFDFLRAGTHATLAPPDGLRRAGPFDYHVSLKLADRPAVYARPFRLSDPLPAVMVPLTADVPAVRADLQAVFARTYDAGLYARRARYDRPCEPPLTPDQAAWAAGVLAARLSGS